ncbi:MAG TPA: MotA/TolQ/ExbB proton channel family protein [Ohtaekwangia sp.]|nr:MotA/TolQ/ExbB proton channel family protein [Ohtaekwangia sp.]
MLKLHVEGGMEWMAPLTIIFLVNIVLAISCLVKVYAKGIVQERGILLVKELGIFALAFGVLGTVKALFMAFGSLSEMTETLPLNAIMGGLQVAMITALYGLIIFLVSLAFFLGLRYVVKTQI